MGGVPQALSDTYSADGATDAITHLLSLLNHSTLEAVPKPALGRPQKAALIPENSTLGPRNQHLGGTPGT